MVPAASSFHLQPQGFCPGCFLCLECSSFCSLHGWLFLITEILWNVISTERFSLGVLFKVLTLPTLVPFHHVAPFYFLFSHMSLSEVFMIWVALLAYIFHGGSGCVLLLILNPFVPKPGTEPGTQWQSINTYWATDWPTDWMNNSKSFTCELP